MNDIHRELLTELVDEWNDIQLQEYIRQLELRAYELDKWIAQVKALKKKKAKKIVYENGPRDGR